MQRTPIFPPAFARPGCVPAGTPYFSRWRQPPDGTPPKVVMCPGRGSRLPVRWNSERGPSEVLAKAPLGRLAGGGLSPVTSRPVSGGHFVSVLGQPTPFAEFACFVVPKPRNAADRNAADTHAGGAQSGRGIGWGAVAGGDAGVALAAPGSPGFHPRQPSREWVSAGRENGCPLGATENGCPLGARCSLGATGRVVIR